MEREKVIEHVNYLIQTSKDSEEGFKSAAENVVDAPTSALFEELSDQRAHFSRELQEVVRQFGGDPEDSGTLSGTLRRGWMNFRTVIATDDKTTVLNECEKAEDMVLDAYEDAMKSRLPEAVSDVVSRQYHDIKAAHDRVRALRDRSRASIA